MGVVELKLLRSHISKTRMWPNRYKSPMANPMYAKAQYILAFGVKGRHRQAHSTRSAPSKEGYGDRVLLQIP